MKPQTDAHKYRQHGSQGRSGPAGTTGMPAPAPICEDEQRVLECLEAAKSGLTAKQVAALVPELGEGVERALACLVERKLVSRLNTLIPVYTARTQGLGIHAE